MNSQIYKMLQNRAFQIIGASLIVGIVLLSVFTNIIETIFNWFTHTLGQLLFDLEGDPNDSLTYYIENTICLMVYLTIRLLVVFLPSSKSNIYDTIVLVIFVLALPFLVRNFYTIPGLFVMVTDLVTTQIHIYRLNKEFDKHDSIEKHSEYQSEQIVKLTTAIENLQREKEIQDQLLRLYRSEQPQQKVDETVNALPKSSQSLGQIANRFHKESRAK